MKISRNIYVCPQTHRPLQCTPHNSEGDEVISGVLSAADKQYPVKDGVPVFIDNAALMQGQADTLQYYDDVSKIYDDVAGLTFRIQQIDEDATRRKMIAPLELKPSHRVLEIACGTGRDSLHIAGQLDGTGQFYLQDLSPGMLGRCREKLKNTLVPTEFVVGDACRLPFPDGYFDAIFSFGGICVFGDIAGSLREMVRVSKKGARIVVGDESLGPWLYDTDYGKVLMHTNPLLKAPLPLEHLPREARDVRVQWVIGGAYFIIDFTVGEGEPPADFDIPIPGERGGTLRTRYYGKLEGVSPEALRLMEAARAGTGKSKHQWLEEAIRTAAAQKEKCP